MNNTKENSDKQALKNFLLDIKCLDALSPWTSKFNLFDVLKISRVEIRHSNMLAWLLDPNERHGLNDMVLQGIIKKIVSTSENLDLDIFNTLLMDFYSFSVLREWRNIDLLVISKTEKFVLCIENKIDSKEHSNQLNRYYKIVNEEYSKYQKLFVYLTPNGAEPSNQHWQIISYQDILDIIESAKVKIELLPEAKMMIDNYTEILRRDIVGDEKLIQICNEIYAKHHKALDLIYENRPDTSYQIANILKEWCADKAKSGIITFDPEKSTKTYIRFTTPIMTNILPEGSEGNSGWKSNSYYYYEIVNQGERIKVMLTVSSINIPEKQRAICDKLISILKPNDKKTDWVWKRLNVWRWYDLNDSDPENLFSEITKRMDNYIKEIHKFEDKLIKMYSLQF